ncbi:nSTAND1 domain-containing NTPase [Streptomyces sp. NPDC003635]
MTGDGIASDLPLSVAQILTPDGQVAGTGFLVAEGVLVTCAHVVEDAGGGPDSEVLLSFPYLVNADGIRGTVPTDLWRSAEREDVAFIRLNRTPAGAWILPLGSAEGRRRHDVRSYGFPAQASREGHLGFGKAGDLLPATESRSALLQLTDANDLTTGFSGGPVFDEDTGLVVGMLTAITAPDTYERGLGIAYATPTEVLREILPELAERDVCPYRGLEPFTAEHAQWFEGRSEAVRQVLANLSQQRRLTLLLGPSGSGKSSLIQAGVLRELADGALPGSDRWLPVLARPRQDMLAEIERAGLPGASLDGITAAVNARLAAETSYQRVLLVIDQFEELLVQSTNGRLRKLLEAIDEVTSAADAYTKVTVILIMRDDFYPQLAARAPKLLEAAMSGLLNVPGTLTQQDLHDIIVLPAENVGLRFQPGLAERIIGDVLDITPEAAVTRQAPVTVLPLLEMTLQQLWDRREDGYLTHEAYERIGEVSGSVTTWCDSALDELSPEQQDIARRALTSLVHPADPSHNITAVRTQVPLHELRDLAADPGATGRQEAVDSVIAALARRRIITTQTLRAPQVPGAPPGEPVAELIHEALIRNWGALRKWVDQDHRFQEWLGRTRERQARWAEKKDPGDLLGGTALAEGLEWSQQRRLPGDIAEFLTASKDRQRSAIRRSRMLNGVLGGLLVLALLAAGGAVWQGLRVGNAKERALSRQLAAQSDELIGTNPEIAALLAVKAYRTSHTAEAVESLQNAGALPAHRRLTGHTDEVRSVAYSPDRRTLASASADGTVRLWDTDTNEVRTTFRSHEVNAVAFHPEDHILATGSADKTIRLWDTDTGKTLTTLKGHTDQVRTVAFHPKGHTLATGSADKTIRLWDTDTGKTLTTLKGHTDQVRTVAFHPKGHTLATGSADKTIRLWDTDTGKTLTTLKEHTEPVTSLAYSPDSRTLASTDGYELRLRHGTTGKTREIPASSALLLAFSPDSKTLAAASDRYVELLDATNGSVRASLMGHSNAVLGLAFSHDSDTLATVSRDRTLRLWRSAPDDRTALAGHTAEIWGVAFSPDGRTLATASADKTVRLRDPATGKLGKTLRGHRNEVNAVAFSRDGRMLATASDDNTARLWDAATGASRTTLKGHDARLWAVAFSPDGRTLATASADGTARLWNTATGTSRAELTKHNATVLAVVFSPDGHTLATAGQDSTARLWDAATGRLRKTLPGHTADVSGVAFSPDGRTLATASWDGTALLWDAATGRARATLTEHTGAVNAVAFSPDGRTLATAGDDGAIRMWDAETGKARTTRLTSPVAITSLEFSPDGNTLATVAWDGTGRLWKVPTSLKVDQAIKKVCSTFDRDLTPEERKAYFHDESDESVCP